MQLANLRNIKFSNFSFYQYFFTAYIGLHISFSLLLGNITAFAPDENLYRDIFSRLYSAGFTSDVLGFYGAWEPWLRLIYLPAKLLTYLGISDLLAARLLAISCSALATYLLIKMAKNNEQDTRVFRTAIIAISFIPTVFLWSSIGLRESFLYLEIISILFFLSRIRDHVDLKNMAGLGFAIFSLAMTKNYIFILFFFAFVITLLIFSIIKRKNFMNHLLILVLALLPLSVNPTLVPAISSYFSGQIAKPESSIVGDINNDGSCEKFEFCYDDGNDYGNDYGQDAENPRRNIATGGMTIHMLLNQLQNQPNTIVAKISQKLGITTKLAEKVEASIQVVSKEVLVENQKKLSLKQAGLKHPDQVIESSLKFLLIPFIFFDNGSLFLNIQSIETPIWLFIYGLFIFGFYQLIKRRRELDYAVLMATLFTFEFVGISALAEVNVGTALRHRSLMLIPILVILVARKKKTSIT
jgi:hypothetical protein